MDLSPCCHKNLKKTHQYKVLQELRGKKRTNLSVSCFNKRNFIGVFTVFLFLHNKCFYLKNYNTIRHQFLEIYTTHRICISPFASI